VRVFTVANAGKAAALNTGLRHARGEIVIALDADTLFEPQAVGALVHRFYDKKLGAIAGNAKVGNRVNLVTRWQALEYITSQNMDRRAFASACGNIRMRCFSRSIGRQRASRFCSSGASAGACSGGCFCKGSVTGR
jgi:cellulose synthase/poly-beta-1,6-N-acetylglucosamine synthase-like glycosyltransferase